jgi:DNA-binding Xre family transcriptional regulator
MSNPHIGSDFDTFLEEEGMLSDATAVAVKRVIAFQLQEAMDAQHMTKTTLAKKMHTSRASLNRLLDDTDTSLTLTTLTNAANVLGRKLKIELAF